MINVYVLSIICALFFAAGLDVCADEPNINDGTTIILEHADQTWIFGIMASIAKKPDRNLVKSILSLIKMREDAVSSENPVILGLVVNTEARGILVWKLDGAAKASLKPPIL